LEDQEIKYVKQEIKYVKQEISSLFGKRELEGAYPEVRVTDILGVLVKA
jgi:hypothetical protein